MGVYTTDIRICIFVYDQSFNGSVRYFRNLCAACHNYLVLCFFTFQILFGTKAGHQHNYGNFDGLGRNIIAGIRFYKFSKFVEYKKRAVRPLFFSLLQAYYLAVFLAFFSAFLSSSKEYNSSTGTIFSFSFAKPKM